MKSLCILFTLEETDLSTFERIEIAKAILELRKTFKIKKIDFFPELNNWNIGDIINGIKEE